KCI
ncbi:hypothetical protein ACTFIU_004888, partial [Dictyostelium citrinum]